MDNSLISLLKNSSFSEKEAEVYLALLELGRGDVTEIAQIADLKRSIIYVILEGLAARGFVSQLPHIKVNTYQPTDPLLILNSLKQNVKYFSEMLPIMQTLKEGGGKRPRITYLESKEGIWKVWEELFDTPEVFTITSYARIDAHFPGELDKWIKERKKGIHKTTGKHIIPDTEEERKFGKLLISAEQKVKTWSALNSISMDFVLYNEKLAITSLVEKPFMVLFESEELAKSMQPLFDLAWRQGKEIGKAKERKRKTKT